jgi:hypothetical protein
MQENIDPEEVASSSGTKGAQPDSDATSSETLEDIEENEDISDSSSDSSVTPSPDGTFDDPTDDRSGGPVSPGPM